MATRYSNINMTAFNKRQLRQAAIEVGVAAPTLHNVQTTPAALKAAILAL